MGNRSLPAITSQKALSGQTRRQKGGREMAEQRNIRTVEIKI